MLIKLQHQAFEKLYKTFRLSGFSCGDGSQFQFPATAFEEELRKLSWPEALASKAVMFTKGNETLQYDDSAPSSLQCKVDRGQLSATFRVSLSETTQSQTSVLAYFGKSSTSVKARVFRFTVPLATIPSEESSCSSPAASVAESETPVQAAAEPIDTSLKNPSEVMSAPLSLRNKIESALSSHLLNSSAIRDGLMHTFDVLCVKLHNAPEFQSRVAWKDASFFKKAKVPGLKSGLEIPCDPEKPSTLSPLMVFTAGHLGDGTRASAVFQDIDRFFDVKKDQYRFAAFIAASGSGKTKTIFDLARKRYLVYFTFPEKADDAGDLKFILETINLKKVNDSTITDYDFKVFAERLLNLLVWSRMLVLLVLRIVFDITKEEFLAFQWASSNAQLFRSVVQSLSDNRVLDRMPASTVWKLCVNSCEAMFGDRIIVACDEAHLFLLELQRSFVIDPSGEKRALSHVFFPLLYRRDIGTIIAGTSMRLRDLDRIVSAIGKKEGNPEVKVFKKFTVLTAEDVETYVHNVVQVKSGWARFLKDNPSALNYLSGRPRFCSNFVHHLLVACGSSTGRGSISREQKAMVGPTKMPHTLKLAFDSMKDEFLTLFSTKVEDRLKDPEDTVIETASGRKQREALKKELLEMVTSFVIGGNCRSFESKEAEVWFSTGVCLIEPCPDVKRSFTAVFRMKEILIIEAVFKAFENLKIDYWQGLRTDLRRVDLRNQTKGDLFEQLVASVFIQHRGKLLSAIPLFHPDNIRPHLSDEDMERFSTLWNEQLQIQRIMVGQTLIESMVESKDELHTYATFPDTAAGPDVVLGVGNSALIFVGCKTSGNSVTAAEVDANAASTTARHFYTQNRNTKDAQLKFPANTESAAIVSFNEILTSRSHIRLHFIFPKTSSMTFTPGVAVHTNPDSISFNIDMSNAHMFFDESIMPFFNYQLRILDKVDPVVTEG
jgi:hypothetical protein